MSDFSCEHNVMTLMYDWPLHEFLKLEQIIEIRSAIDYAKHKDDEKK